MNDGYMWKKGTHTYMWMNKCMQLGIPVVPLSVKIVLSIALGCGCTISRGVMNFRNYRDTSLRWKIDEIKLEKGRVQSAFFPFLVYYFSLSFSILYLSCLKILHFYFIICPKQAERGYKTVCGCAGCVFIRLWASRYLDFLFYWPQQC